MYCSPAIEFKDVYLDLCVSCHLLLRKQDPSNHIEYLLSQSSICNLHDRRYKFIIKQCFKPNQRQTSTILLPKLHCL